jgi:hypothetical protein
VLRKNMLCRFWMWSIHLLHTVHAKLFECELILNVYYSEERNGTEAKNLIIASSQVVMLVHT